MLFRSPPVTATVSQTHKACGQTAPVTSITPASVPLSNTIANTSTVTSQVATPTFPPVVVKQLTQPKPFNGSTPWKTYKEYYERVKFAQLMVGSRRRRKLKT